MNRARWLFSVVTVLMISAAQAAELKPAAPDIDTLIKQLDDEDYASREKASKALLALGEKARKPLEKLLKETKDADLNSRADAILGVLNMPKDFAALTPEEREIAKLEFTTTVSEDGKTVTFKNYGYHSDFISDFGNVRIVVDHEEYSGESSGTITTSGGGSTSVQAGSFSVKSSKGIHNISFRKLAWKVEGSIVKVDTEETGFGGATNRVIFLDKTGKFRKRVDMPQEKSASKK
jgi:hypothetical protein